MIVCQRRGNRQKTRFESSNGRRDRAPVLEKKRRNSATRREISASDSRRRENDAEDNQGWEGLKVDILRPHRAVCSPCTRAERRRRWWQTPGPLRSPIALIGRDSRCTVDELEQQRLEYGIELREQWAAKMTLTASTELFPAYFCRREWNNLSICHLPLARNRVL